MKIFEDICFLVQGSLIVSNSEMAELVQSEPRSMVALNINKANHLLDQVSVGSAHQGKLLSILLGVGDAVLGTLHPVLGPQVNRDM